MSASTLHFRSADPNIVCCLFHTCHDWLSSLNLTHTDPLWDDTGTVTVQVDFSQNLSYDTYIQPYNTTTLPPRSTILNIQNDNTPLTPRHPSPAPRPFPPPRRLSLHPRTLHHPLDPPNRQRLPLHKLPASNRHRLRAQRLLRALAHRPHSLHRRDGSGRMRQAAAQCAAESEGRAQRADHASLSTVLLRAVE